jgi:hypothetical protein
MGHLQTKLQTMSAAGSRAQESSPDQTGAQRRRRSRWNVTLSDVCFEAHYGLKSDIALGPKSADGRHWHRQIGDTHFIAGSENTGAGPFL